MSDVKDPWPCRECRAMMVSGRTWSRLPKPRAYRAHRGDNLCGPCHRRVQAKGEGAPARRLGRPRVDALRACLQCKRSCMPHSQAAKLTPDQRAQAKRDGIQLTYTRRLCGTCYKRCADEGTLIDVEPTNRRRAELREEWEQFGNPAMPLQPQIRELAPRLGVSEWSLEQAIRAGGVRSAWGNGGWKRKDGAA